MQLTVIIPTHNPDPARLRRTLLGLRAQTLQASAWEAILVNNASTALPGAAFWTEAAPPNFSTVEETSLGLGAARRRGILAARGGVMVLVDDDNVLAPDYLAQALAIFARHPRVGVAGGKSSPEFERAPGDWQREFFPLLALRDLGPVEMISRGLRHPGTAQNVYPDFAPIGAGMALRREAAQAWLDTTGPKLADRRGRELSSSGDNEMILCAMRAGWEVGYFPELVLTHLIPSSRLDPAYLARLNHGIQQSWMHVLALHDANPWLPLSPFGARLRELKAWFTHRAWSSPAAYIRWRGACGHFAGRALSRGVPTHGTRP